MADKLHESGRHSANSFTRERAAEKKMYTSINSKMDEQPYHGSVKRPDGRYVEVIIPPNTKRSSVNKEHEQPHWGKGK